MTAKKKEASAPAPKPLEWRHGTYGGATLRLADGLVVVYCDYALVSRGEDNYYYARVNDLKLKKKFDDMASAKAAGVRVAFKLASMAAEQLKNFLEE
jgi:hypothetical protein